MSDLEIKVEGIERLKRRLSAFAPQKLVSLNREIGYNIQERTADWLAQASVTRHKSAEDLGAKHTGFLEFAPGRVRSFSRFKGDGKRPEIHTANESASGVDIVFENTPGLRRAFGPLLIRPVKAKALTIPKDKVSYGRRVSELRAEGHVIYRPKGTRILVEDIKGGKRKKKDGGKPNWRVLYLLVGKVTLKHDPDLLPDAQTMGDWATDTIEAFVDLHAN